MTVENDDEFNQPYLPERYKQKVQKKQRQRRIKRFLSASCIIITVVIVLWILTGFFGVGLTGVPVTESAHPDTTVPSVIQSTASSPVSTIPTPAATTAPAPEYTIESTVPVTASENSLSLAGAVAILRDYYLENDYTIRSVNYTEGSSRNLFGFTLQPVGNSERPAESVVFIDAATGMPYSPGQETALFSMENVEGVVFSAFPDTGGDSMRVWYSSDPVRGGVWMFRVHSGNTTLVSGRLDAATGKIVSFSRNIPHSGRPADPSITQEKAQMVASNYVRDQNGGIPPLNLSSADYESWGTPSVPAAGQYVFSWQRLFLDYPVDTDSIRVAVDAVTVDVIGYNKQWTTPDYAFSQTVEQAVAQRDATFAVMQAAKSMYPDSVESVRIRSSEIRWNNYHRSGSTQRPGSVALAWKIVFDDDTIRADSTLSPGIGWVDIQTGTVTAMEYNH